MKKLLPLLACFWIVCYYNAECQLSTSLEEYYKLDESSGTVYNSVNSSVNPSSAVSATYSASGRINTALSFNGTSNYISFADNANWTINASGMLSISMWLYFSGNQLGTYINLWGHPYGPMLYLTNQSAGNYSIDWWTLGSNVASSGTKAISLNAWHHIVFVKNGSSVSFYLDGIATNTTATDVTKDPSGVFIGGESIYNQDFYGRIDEVGIWKRAITSAEVTQLYNSGSGLAYPFTTTTYTLTTAASPTAGGTVTLSPSGGQYVSGTSVTATATANSGYAFNGWTGAATGTTNPVSFTMDANKTLTATFTATTTYTLTITAPTNGTITTNPTGTNFASGTTVTLTAAPATGYQFSNWGGSLSGSTNPTTLVMNGNKTVSATFTALPAGSDNLGNHTATQNIRLSGFWISNDGGNEGIRVDNNGNIGVGTANPTQPLTVRGKILATEIEVVSSISADYVFEPEYKLMPLTDLELYLEQNKHLPGIPSVAEFSTQGQNLGKMDDLLLRKIEELTLYIIRQNQLIEELRKDLNTIKGR